MLAAVLKPSGSLISQTDSGALALDSVLRNKTDLLLVHNLGSPDMNGLDVIRRIRLSGSTIPIIVLSRRTDESGTVMAAFDLGADTCITKAIRGRGIAGPDQGFAALSASARRPTSRGRGR
jgi:two-component system KDP operon response regulator KdpE